MDKLNKLPCPQDSCSSQGNTRYQREGAIFRVVGKTSQGRRRMNRELSRAVRELVGSVDTACQAGRPGQMCLKDREPRCGPRGTRRGAGRETSRDTDRTPAATGQGSGFHCEREGVSRGFKEAGGEGADPVRAF